MSTPGSVGLWKTTRDVSPELVRFFRSKKYRVVRAEGTRTPLILMVCGVSNHLSFQSHRELWRAAHRYRKAPILVVPTNPRTRQSDFPDWIPGRVWKETVFRRPEHEVKVSMVHRWIKNLLVNAPWPLSEASVLLPEPPEFGTPRTRRFPTGKWKPKAWFSVQNLMELPPWLMDRSPVDLTVHKNDKTMKPYLTNCGQQRASPGCCEIHHLKEIPLTTVIDRCPLNLSLMLFIDNWPLEYIPQRYLNWYASEGIISEGIHVQTEHPLVAVPLHMVKERPEDWWPHPTKSRDKEFGLFRNKKLPKRTYWMPTETRITPYGDLKDDVLKVLGKNPVNQPWTGQLTVPEHLKAYAKCLTWNHTIIEEEELNWKSFYPTGYWSNRSFLVDGRWYNHQQIGGTWMNEFISAGRSNRNKWGSDPLTYLLLQVDQETDQLDELIGDGKTLDRKSGRTAVEHTQWTFHGRPNEAEWIPPQAPKHQSEAALRLNERLEELERMEARFARIQEASFWKFNERDRVQYFHDREEALDRLRSIQEEVWCLLEPYLEDWSPNLMDHFWDQLSVTARQLLSEPEELSTEEPVNLEERWTKFIEADCARPIDSLTWLAALMSQNYRRPKTEQEQRKVSRSVEKSLKVGERQARTAEEVKAQRDLRRVMQVLRPKEQVA